MPMWDETQDGSWGNNPVFPTSSGSWIPMRLFTIAEGINVHPSVVLGVLVSIAGSVDVYNSSNAEILSVLNIMSDTAISSSQSSSLSSRVGLGMSTDAIWSSETRLTEGDFGFDHGALISASVGISLISILSTPEGIELIRDIGLRYVGTGSFGAPIGASHDSRLTSIAMISSSLGISISQSLGLGGKFMQGHSQELIFGADSGIGFSPRDPVVDIFSTPGTYTYTIPRSYNFTDIVVIGAGASGQTGSGSISKNGRGGTAGKWNYVTIELGVHMEWSETTMQVTVGQGGDRPANSDNAGPNYGGRSEVSLQTSPVIGGHIYTCTGLGGNTDRASGQNGEGAENISWNGQGYTGGNGGTGNAGSGSQPGGAGAGGNGGIFGSRTRGGAGGNGMVWIRSYQ